MIIIRFHGGLGNQMFEYAFFKYMEKRYPGKVKADLTWFDRNFREHQGYELEKVFGISLPTASYEEVAKIHEYYPKYYKFAPLRFLAKRWAKKKNAKRIAKGDLPTGEHVFDFGPTQYEKNPIFDKLDANKDWYIEGVFCSDEYLADVEMVVKRDFAFSVPENDKLRKLEEEMKSCESVAIHVRRGDYVGNVFDVVRTEYYQKACEYVAGKVKNPTFYIFSDDMDYVKKEFSFLQNYQPVHNAGSASYTDMMLISKCRHAIIANSSFSYWGALLGEREGSIVIAPEKYKADETIALARKNWILI